MMKRRFSVKFSVIRSLLLALMIVCGISLITYPSLISAQENLLQLRLAHASIEGGHPLSAMIDEGRFVSPKGPQHVKFSFVFEEPSRVDRVSFESCTNDFKDGVDLYAQPGLRSAFAEGGGTKISIRVPAGSTEPIRSLALNFRHNEDFCVKNLKFLASNGRPLEPSPTANQRDTRQREPQAVSLFGQIAGAFSGPGLALALDREIATHEEKDNWMFRFRGDGTFFVRGYGDDMKMARAFSALGTYEVLHSGRRKIKLRLKGEKLASAHPWDGALCGADCGEKPSGRDTLVTDVIVIERLKGREFMVRNRTSRRERTLSFSDLRTKVTSL